MDNTNSSKTVLIVDDEELITKALAKKLEGGGGYSVLVRRNGEDGLKAALAEKPDLILLDMIMPKMDGMSVLTALREDEWGKEVPVIVLTNLESGEEADKSRQSGVFDYLVKTNWSLSDVLDRVNDALKN